MMKTTTAAAVAALFLGGCARGTDGTQILASGHVEATEVRISTKVAGRLESLLLQEGDVVRVAQVLGTIATTDLKLALEQARAERDQAAAEYRLRLVGARKEDIAELEAQIGSVRSDLESAQKDLGRMQGLLDKGSGTGKARDDATTRRDMAAHRLDAMSQALARMKAGSRPEEKDASRARLAAMEARVAQLGQQLKDATILSPLAGVVTERVAEPGELLQVGSPLCMITDLANAWLTVYVSGPDLSRIRLGQEAQVTTDDRQTRKGKVTFIASQAEFTPKNVQTRDERVKLVYRVKVSLDNQDGLFKPGMPAEARLQAAETAR
jgi:HlyD family secretion protein